MGVKFPDIAHNNNEHGFVCSVIQFSKVHQLQRETSNENWNRMQRQHVCVMSVSYRKFSTYIVNTKNHEVELNNKLDKNNIIYYVILLYVTNIVI